jgi:hypothetical protein
MIGSYQKSANASVVSPQRQLTGEFPKLSPIRAFEYYNSWDQIKTSTDVKHQKLWGRGIEVTSKNAAFNKLVKNWIDVTKASKKISEALYSLLITGNFFIEKQFTPDGRLGNIEHIPMTTIYRMFRDQYANELKIVQLVDGIYKELEPKYYIHGMINNPMRDAFGYSDFHTLASPRPITSAVDPITGEPINPTRNARSLLDAQAILQNAEIEIKEKMAKPRIIASVPGMPRQQMEEIKKEMADPNNDQWIWLVDRQVETKELVVNGQTKFDAFGDNVDAHIDIGTVFSSNVIKNPSAFSYAGSQTPLDVVDQRMMDIAGDICALLRDELFQPLAESWGFKDIEKMEIKVIFLPIIKKLVFDDINKLDKNAVSPKEIRKLYKDHNISLDDRLYEEWEEKQKEETQEKPQVRVPKNPDSPLTKDKPLFQSEAPKPTRTPTPTAEVLKKIVTEAIEKALERVDLSPLVGTMSPHTDLLGMAKDQPPQITDPTIRDVYGLDQDEKDHVYNEPQNNTPDVLKATNTNYDISDVTQGRFTNKSNQGIPKIKNVQYDEYLGQIQKEPSKSLINKTENPPQGSDNEKDLKEEDPNLKYSQWDNLENNRDIITLDDKKKQFAEKPLKLKNDKDGLTPEATPEIYQPNINYNDVTVADRKEDQRQTTPKMQKEPKVVRKQDYDQELNTKQAQPENKFMQTTDKEDKDQLHVDPETGRNITSTPDEQGNYDPDLRFDQTPNSKEDQPEVERSQKTISLQEFEQEKKKNKRKKVSLTDFKEEFGKELKKKEEEKNGKT